MKFTDCEKTFTTNSGLGVYVTSEHGRTAPLCTGLALAKLSDWARALQRFDSYIECNDWTQSVILRLILGPPSRCKNH